MKLLLVEDDLDLAQALGRVLEKRGYAVQTCGDGLAALQLMRDEVADVVILDLNIPGIDGLQLLQRARAAGLATPVLVLTARGAVGDRIAGLNAGADDYLPKPFDLDELEARLRALFRRAAGDSANAGRRPVCGRLAFERDSASFYLDDAPLALTPRESALLQALALRVGHAVSRDKLHRLIFGTVEQAQDDAIEVIVHRLRKKLVATEVEILTLRGLGYLLRDAPAKVEA